jgi:hypothetical protein
VGAGDDQGDVAGLEPDRGVAADSEQEEDRIIGAGFRRGIDSSLEIVPQSVAVNMIAQFGEFDVENMGGSGEAITGLALEDIAGD